MICNTIETLKKYLPSVVSNSFGKYEADVSDANNWIRKEVLGNELYEKITAEDFDNDELLGLCEAVVARKAYLTGIPSFDLMETEAGFVVARNENQVPASPERVKRLIDQVEAKLASAIEDLLYWLENSDEDYKESWQGSEAYSLIKDVYIHSLTDFRRYAPWNQSRLAWAMEKANMRKVIRLNIEPVISKELSDEIIEQLKKNELSDSNKTIIEDLKFGFAGFVSGQDETGMSFMNRIRKKLMANPSDFPAWENSTLYIEITANPRVKYDSTNPIFRGGF